MRIQFISDVSMVGRSVDVVNTPTGTMRVSSVETTVLDLVAHPRRSGGLSNVATIVGEMLDEGRIDVARLVEVAACHLAAVVQRCGWLLDFMAEWIKVRSTPTPWQKPWLLGERSPRPERQAGGRA